ncbi:MAG: signal peptidase II [Deltaproteobacteria bacterium]|nr:MAG: signal peptidase II [Deltaproteobacteria bacterium]
MQKHSGFILVFVIVVFLDQLTKIIIVNYIPYLSEIKIIPDFFSLVNVRNPGGAFGFLANQSDIVRIVVFIGMAFIAAGVVLWFYKTTPKEFIWLRLAYAMILGGAAGNLTDRIRLGYVIDFFDVYIKNMHWPAFNIADSAITISMGIVVYHALFKNVTKD